MSNIYAAKIYVKNYELLYTASYAQSPAAAVERIRCILFTTVMMEHFLRNYYVMS